MYTDFSCDAGALFACRLITLAKRFKNLTGWGA